MNDQIYCIPTSQMVVNSTSEILNSQVLANSTNQTVNSQLIGDQSSRLFKLRRPDLYLQIDRSRYNKDELDKIDKLTFGSNVKLWWICSSNKVCNCHVWEAQINERIRKNSGCPFCSSSKTCSHMSFMNDKKLANEYAWDLNIGIDPWKISKYSHIELWFRCSSHKTCDEHIWSAQPHNRSRETNCPFCINYMGQVCLCNSFMNNPLLTLLRDEFDSNHQGNIGINPYKLSSGSEQNVWWKCSTCYFSWSTLLYYRSNGNGCPKCSEQRTESKGEERCRLYLESLQIQYYSQSKLSYIPTRRYDFGFSKENNIFLIEIDGSQHFVFTEHWHKTHEIFRYFQQVDKIKTIIPILLGYNILRISNDNEIHIKNCINIFIHLKTLLDFNNIPLIVFDDMSKYLHLINDFNSDIVRQICDDKYYEEIMSKLKFLTLNVYCIKSGTFRKINVVVDGRDWI